MTPIPTLTDTLERLLKVLPWQVRRHGGEYLLYIFNIGPTIRSEPMLVGSVHPAGALPMDVSS